MKRLFVVALALSLHAKADIVCEADTVMGKLLVQISDSQVKVSGAALSSPKIFSNLNQNYDGHMTSLITGKGIAVSFQNHYGCIRNAKITTDLRENDGVGYIDTVSVKGCKGGSTPDQLCFRRD
jgi:hypothetical protein